ncbi:amino acid oxidase [Echinicola strongylocentroti]|uniref:Amino acid oxidase n=1 Tax=Echinicola strongylocentroti TaxID=1795355 RepID=A0A2Z4IN53_9BACT|nr:FAD-dependent oxidoreductase [Echinicola strongylocentroti]AWW32325.1 amino acid oxidase [Echinicola strongylocentroti]
MDVDFLLIGQGLAGTVLSYRLMDADQSILVIDQPAGNNSSRVAAGLFNPITGRKMVKTWNADRLFPCIKPLYAELEKLIGQRLIYDKAIYRPFFGVDEQNEWMGKSCDEDVQAYLEEVRTQPLYDEVHDPYGGIVLKNSGYLDINVLLDEYNAWLKAKGRIKEENFDEEQLVHEGGKWRYQGITAKAIIYCNGLGAAQSSYFQWLPFAPVKGEILEMESEFVPEEIINRGVFRITMPDLRVRVGSTYSWHDLDIGPTEQGKEEILARLEKIVQGQAGEVLSHRTGVRPATKDRKPLLGKHPSAKNVYIFNGFGAKGVSLVPYYSNIMLDLLLENAEPEKDVNISRFFKYI